MGVGTAALGSIGRRLGILGLSLSSIVVLLRLFSSPRAIVLLWWLWRWVLLLVIGRTSRPRGSRRRVGHVASIRNLRSIKYHYCYPFLSYSLSHRHSRCSHPRGGRGVSGLSLALVQADLGHLDETLGGEHPSPCLGKVACHQGRVQLVRSIIVSISDIYSIMAERRVDEWEDWLTPSSSSLRAHMSMSIWITGGESCWSANCWKRACMRRAESSTTRRCMGRARSWHWEMSVEKVL